MKCIINIMLYVNFMLPTHRLLQSVLSDPVDPTTSTEADKLTFEMCNVCRGGRNIQRGSAFQSQFQSGYFTDPDFDPTEYTPVPLTEKQQELLRRVWSKYSKGSDMLRHAAMTFSKYDPNFSMMPDLDNDARS
jgi:hypothetical protein